MSSKFIIKIVEEGVGNFKNVWFCWVFRLNLVSFRLEKVFKIKVGKVFYCNCLLKFLLLNFFVIRMYRIKFGIILKVIIFVKEFNFLFKGELICSILVVVLLRKLVIKFLVMKLIVSKYVWLNNVIRV